MQQSSRIKFHTLVLKKIMYFLFSLICNRDFSYFELLIHAQNVVVFDDKLTLSVVGRSRKKIPSDRSKVITTLLKILQLIQILLVRIMQKKWNKIISALNAKGLTDKNISTSNFEIIPNYDNQNNNYKKIISHTALNSITLTTSANVNISSFIDLAINNGVNRVENI